MASATAASRYPPSLPRFSRLSIPQQQWRQRQVRVSTGQRNCCATTLWSTCVNNRWVAMLFPPHPWRLLLGCRVRPPEAPLHYEHTVFLLQPGDPVEACASRQADEDVVKYGQTLRLLHYASQRCLVYNAERRAAGAKGDLRVLFGKHQWNAKVLERWRIMPRYRLRVEGEPVVAGDCIALQALETERYSNVAPNVDEEATDHCSLEISLGDDIQGFFDAPLRR
ncbi:hypothetical protein JKF63_05228 [Porcisia hertigi]|uniref:MIR domain-containing protein n=1 Tax=Porcisia hertigi TaxID=2761500 RepID=A0A836LGV1_9TRYP|nr:hypothetical protein JKF63_05228 [Porcisia hertigi]